MRVSLIVPSQEEFGILFEEPPIKSLSGGGLSDIRIYDPVSHSLRGTGLFSMLAGLARKAIPFLTKTIFPEVLNLGQSVLSDVNRGSDIRSALKRRGLQSLKSTGARILRGGRRKKVVKQKRKKRVIRRVTKKRKLNRYNDVFSNF